MGKGGKKAQPQGKASSAPQSKASSAPGSKGSSAPGGGGRHSRRQRASGGWCRAVEAQLDAGLAALGLVRSGIAGDGNCLFATIAEQHLGSAHRHPETRALAIATMRACPAAFQPYLLEEDLADLHATDYDSYLDKMAQEREWGGNLELTALANALARSMVVHRAGERPYVLAPSEPAAAARAQLGQPFHLAYDGQHYDSVREIAGAVVGVRPAAGDPGSEGAPQDDPKVAALLQAFSGMSLSRERAQAALLAARGVLDGAIEAIAVGLGGCAGGGAEGAEEGAPAAQQSDGEGAAAAAPSPPPAAAPPPPQHPGGKKGGVPPAPAGPPAAAKAPPRNKPCPCGSALPYKKCCASKPRAGSGGSGAPRPSAVQDSPGRSSLAATFGGLDV